MASPDLDAPDLQLLVSAADTGSIGAAARSLQVSQPSASLRLSRIERRLGVSLFDRGPTGVRPTPAGRVLVERARRALDIVAVGIAEARETADHPRVAVGTIASLAPAVFTALDQRLAARAHLVQRSDHGHPLLQAVLDGALDAAVVCLTADQLPAAGVRRITLGRDPVVLFLPQGCNPLNTRFPLRNRNIIVHLTSGNALTFAERVVRAGGRPRIAQTAQTGMAMARASGDLALLPASSARADCRHGELIEPSPVRHRADVTLVIADVPSPATRLIHETVPHLQRLFDPTTRQSSA